jgi:hypothetical protein
VELTPNLPSSLPHIIATAAFDWDYLMACLLLVTGRPASIRLGLFPADATVTSQGLTLLKPIASRSSCKRLGSRSGIFGLCFDSNFMLMRPAARAAGRRGDEREISWLNQMERG